MHAGATRSALQGPDASIGREFALRHAATRSAGLGSLRPDSDFSQPASGSSWPPASSRRRTEPTRSSSRPTSSDCGQPGRSGRLPCCANWSPRSWSCYSTLREPHHGFVARESLASLDSRSAEPAARLSITHGGRPRRLIRTERNGSGEMGSDSIYFSFLTGRPLGRGAARLPAKASILARKRSLPKAQALLVASRIASISASDSCVRKSCR
jgi:hypothetical protein